MSNKQQSFFLYLMMVGLVFFLTSLKDEKNTIEQKIKKGKVLFHAKKEKKDSVLTCAGCHNVKEENEFSWNPSALEIAEKVSLMDSSEYIEMFSDFMKSGVFLTAHETMSLDSSEIELTRLYLLHLYENSKAPKVKKTFRLNAYTLIAIVFIFLLVDLFLIKGIKRKSLHLLVFFVLLLVFFFQVVYEAKNVGYSEGYAPLQPIRFSHKVHAGENKIDCYYCHFTSEREDLAGIPPMNTCKSCHKVILEGSRSGAFELSKLLTIYDTLSPDWVRVNRLPDYAVFHHSQHVGVAKLACERCHGDVSSMDVVRQEGNLSMGWCLRCHRDRKIHLQDGGYYEKTFVAFANEDSVCFSDIGGTDCITCHY